jgi:citrate lyase beta subunit
MTTPVSWPRPDPLRGAFVARTDSPIQLDALDTVLSTVETESGQPSRSVAVVASFESPSAVLAAAAIARTPRVAHDEWWQVRAFQLWLVAWRAYAAEHGLDYVDTFRPEWRRNWRRDVA